MKSGKFLVLVLLLISILACNLPILNSDSQSFPVGVSSVTVSPHSGFGQFSARVVVQAGPGERTLICAITGKNGNDILVYEYTLHNPDGVLARNSYPFDDDFTFNYSEPGAHSLVCVLDNNFESAWSDDFIVLQETPTPTPVPSPTLTPTATVAPFLTFQGTFEIPEAYIICRDNTQSPNPASIVKGPIEVIADYSTGLASVTIEGTGGEVESSSCGAKPSVTKYTLTRSTITGTINTDTGELLISGDAKLDFWSSCWSGDGDTCTAGGHTGTPIKVTLTGYVDPIQHTVSGKITWGTSTKWGEWQAK